MEWGNGLGAEGGHDKEEWKGLKGRGKGAGEG